MKFLLSLILFVGINTFAQKHTIKVGVGGAAAATIDTANISKRIDSLKSSQVTVSNLKTINSQPITGSGNLNITAIPTPEADFYSSVASGNNGYNGSSKLTAKKGLRSLDSLINASTAPTITVALEGGSKFSGTEGISLTRGGVTIKSYNTDLPGKNSLPVISGTTVYNSGWTLVNTNSYRQSIPNTVFIDYGTYGYVYVIEIDTALEKTDPWGSRKQLRFLASAAAVDKIFIDPARGNFNLSNTPQADSVRALMAGMAVPLMGFVGTPSRAQCISDVENNSFTPVSKLFGKLD